MDKGEKEGTSEDGRVIQHERDRGRGKGEGEGGEGRIVITLLTLIIDSLPMYKMGRERRGREKNRIRESRSSLANCTEQLAVRGEREGTGGVE